MDTRHRAEWGRRAEQAVADVLVAAGWRLLARNWICRGGELDIVVERDGRLRAVEVKYRRRPDDTWDLVSRAQQRRIVRATERFVADSGRDWAEVGIVVAVVSGQPGGLHIRWLDDPFSL